MADEQHNDNETITFGILHSAILQTGADVRSLGNKVDTLVQAQNSATVLVTGELARLKGIDESQQRQLDMLIAGVDKRSANRLSVWGILMGGFAFLATAAQALAAFMHK